jgi:predicted nucleic acid-binding protein
VKKIVLDTNVYIDWLNRGLHETVMLGPGLVRYLSAVVVMELRAGVSHRASRDAVDALTRGYRSAGRLVAPSSEVFERAGAVLRKLKLAGHNVRDASLCNDVLIALTARSIGATVVTANAADFASIQQVEPFAFELP